LELCREIARRFNYLFNVSLFPEPQALLSKVPVIPGIDGRKMSKSYNNYISLTDSTEEIRDKTRMMITDPARIKKTDPGHPEVCTVFVYHGMFNQEETDDVEIRCRRGEIGCVACKARLAQRLDQLLQPIRDKRNELMNHPGQIHDMLKEGAEKARQVASRTLEEVREAMRI